MNCHENQATSKKETALRTLSIVAITAFAFLALPNLASAQDWQDHGFQLSSTTFENGATMPISTIYDYQYNGVNVCSLDGSPGGDESTRAIVDQYPAWYAQFRRNRVRCHGRRCALGHVQHLCRHHRAS